MDLSGLIGMTVMAPGGPPRPVCAVKGWRVQEGQGAESDEIFLFVVHHDGGWDWISLGDVVMFEDRQ